MRRDFPRCSLVIELNLAFIMYMDCLSRSLLDIRQGLDVESDRVCGHRLLLSLKRPQVLSTVLMPIRVRVRVRVRVIE